MDLSDPFTNVFNGILAVANKNAFPILVDIGFIPFFFGDNDINSTSKYLDIADVLFVFDLVFLGYSLFSLTFGWKAIL